MGSQKLPQRGQLVAPAKKSIGRQSPQLSHTTAAGHHTHAGCSGITPAK